VQNSLVDIVADLKRANISGLSKDLRTLIGTANQKLTDLDVNELSGRIAAAAGAVESFVKSPEAQQSLGNLNAAIADLRTLLAKIDGQVGPVSEEFKRTLADAQGALKSVDAAAASARRFVQAQGNLGEDLTRTLQEISQAADAFQRLAEMIERNPNALLVGRKAASESK
jgi:paraquat-inducible protein B